ncbi:MAG: tRNA lysidine(34) synthetase TilS [Thermoanaerobaculum sp.]
MLELRFAASFRRHFPDLLGQRLVVGFSGGADSTALTLLLFRTRDELGVFLVLAHVHHGLRGREADEDAAFCRELAARLGLPFTLEKLPPPPSGVSREAWWRKERYRVLDEVRQSFDAAAMATGHTLDDQAETVLFKLLRGSGPRGVAGIRRRLGCVIRPLLDFRRQELREFLAGLGQPHREDSSNWAADRPRTFLRWRVLPLLTEAFPRAVEHVAAFGFELGEDEALLQGEVTARAPLLWLGFPVPVAQVRVLPPPLRRRWLLGVASHLPLAEPPSRGQLELFSQLLETGSPRGVDLGGRWVVAREGANLVLRPPPLAPFAPVSVRVPGVFGLPGGFTLGLGEGVRRPDYRVYLSPRVQDARLTVESAPPGLRFCGREVRRELARQGVFREWRAAWPVLLADGTIVWVPGVGVLPAWAQASGVLAELEEPWERHGKSSLPRPSPSG